MHSPRCHRWTGALCLHYAIKALTHDAASSGGLDPDRVSFTRALRAARRSVRAAVGTASAAVEAALHAAIVEITRELLPERRLRAAARVVKRKMSNYGVKRGEHCSWRRPEVPVGQGIRILTNYFAPKNLRWFTDPSLPAGRLWGCLRPDPRRFGFGRPGFSAFTGRRGASKPPGRGSGGARLGWWSPGWRVGGGCFDPYRRGVVTHGACHHGPSRLLGVDEHGDLDGGRIALVDRVIEHRVWATTRVARPRITSSSATEDFKRPDAVSPWRARERRALTSTRVASAMLDSAMSASSAVIARTVALASSLRNFRCAEIDRARRPAARRRSRSFVRDAPPAVWVAATVADHEKSRSAINRIRGADLIR